MSGRRFFLALVLLSIACVSRQQADEAQPTQLVIGTGVDIVGVNQLVGGQSRFQADVLDLLFLRLLEEQPDFAEHPPTFAPELAAGYDWSEDGKVVTFHLQPDATWSDGTPITAEDVHWTYTAQTSPDVAWGYAHSKEAIEKVEVLDDLTVAFHLREVHASTLADLNEGVILPRHAWSALPFNEWQGNAGWFRERLVVSGPYTLASWRQQEEIVLKRNDRYFRQGLPRIDRLIFRIVPDKANRVQQLLVGELDFVEHVPIWYLEDFARSDSVEIATYWGRQYTYLVWNGCREPFVDARVRRALTLAIDRGALVEALWGEHARVGISPIIQSTWAYDPQIESWPYDPEEARRLLAESGWTDSDGDGLLDRNGEPFRFELSTNADNRLRVDAAAIIQQHLARVGVDAQPVTLEFNTLIDRNIAHDFDASIGAWVIDTTLDLGYAFHSDAADGGYNYGCYANPELDRLIDEMGRLREQQQIGEVLAAAQAIVHHDQPYTFLWEPMKLDGMSRRIRDATPNSSSALFGLEEWSVHPPP